VIDWSTFDIGETRATCPSCGRSPRDRTLGVRVKPDGRGVAHCFRCEYVETSGGERRTHAPSAKPASRAPERRETLSPWGCELWNACRPVSGPARAYLEARSCAIPSAQGHLRWHPNLAHRPSGHAGPALVAMVTDVLTGAPLTLHRTWIRPDGRKADVAPPRMLLGGHRKAGGVVRLWPDDELVAGLGVAEGIETALTLAHAHRPVWAAIDAGNLAALPVVPGIESLVVAADHDPAGISAATACATRWKAAGRAVRVVMPEAPGMDLNDVARAA